MKKLLSIASLIAAFMFLSLSAQAESMTSIKINENMTKKEIFLVEEAFDYQTLEEMKEQVKKGFEITVTIVETDEKSADKHCKISVSKKFSGKIEGSVGGKKIKIGKAHASGNGNETVNIEGPCKEVQKLYEMYLNSLR